MPQTKQHPKGSTPHPQGGFTIIEVMVALVIFTFGILSVLGMQVTSIQGNADAQNISEAASVGANMAEELMTGSYTDSDMADGAHGPEYKNENKYQMNWTVATNTDNTKAVNITVQWSDGGHSRQVAYNLIKAED